MNKNDLERMLSLADDRYVEELFSEKISMSKRRPYALFAGCAAALIAVAAGINLLVGDPGGSDDITDLNRIQTETTFTESALPLSGIDGENENSEYRMYFRKAPENTIDVQNYDTGGLRYEFTGDYVREVVPFETDRYHDTLAGIFCDNEGNPVNTVIQFRNDYIVFQLNDGMNITINENGELFPQYSLEEYTPVKRFGVDVYGFEIPADKYGNSLYLYFVSGGRGYSISFYNGASYDEAGAVMDAIILNGLSSSDFDLSKGIKKGTVHEKISLDEANKLEDFKGYMPYIETFRADEGNYVLASSTFYSKSTNDISEGQQVTLKYQLEQDENTYILMNYDTMFEADPQGFMSIKIADLDIESIEKFSSTISNGNNETYPYYSFTIIFDDFHIFVSAQNCSADTLWKLLSQIPRVPSGTIISETKENISLAEANEIGSFKGYVPQIEHIPSDEGKEYTVNANTVDFYRDNVLYRQYLDVSYHFGDENNVVESSKESYIYLLYDTDESESDYGKVDSISIDELSRETVEKFYDPYEDNGEPCSFCNFIIRGKSLYITIVAQNCSFDELWSVLSQIPNS